LGQFTDPSCVAAELYEGSANLRPEKSDVLVMLHGAHHRMHTKAHVELFEAFVGAVADKVAAKFPGRVLWVEPFVQHFRRGNWVDDTLPGSHPTPAAIKRAALDNTGGPEPQGCWSLDDVDDSMQRLKAALVREAAASVPGVRVVPVYHTLEPLADCHASPLDCTHYLNPTYFLVWKTIAAVMAL